MTWRASAKSAESKTMDHIEILENVHKKKEENKNYP